MKLDALNDGFSYIPGVLSNDEECVLVDLLAQLPYGTITLRGVTARRRVACYGFEYGYASRTALPGLPLPPVLHAIKTHCAQVVGVLDRFDQVIVSEYPPGAGIGWHTDAAVFGETILGLSLGAPARLQLRERDSTRVAGAFRLEPRSLYALRGQARWRYQHRLVPVAATRYSLTFREVVAKEA
jgi:DNA oxidative demethylase